MDYRERRLAGIDIWGINPTIIGGDNVIQATVRFTLSDREDGDFGPNATVEVSVLGDNNMKIADAERALLGAAISLLKRVLHEPSESMHPLLSDTRKRSFVGQQA